MHPTILWWSIGFLAKNSSSCYKEVQKVMRLPDISYVYKKMKELVSRSDDTGFGIHFTTLQTMKERADRENWTTHQRTGVIAEDSANINTSVEHDIVSNKFIGGDESHRLGTFSKLFATMAKEVRDKNKKEGETQAQVRYCLHVLYLVIFSQSQSYTI